ncbi:hypothetical protein H6P81_018488 [Aristolochia fimbriata]|uniref:Uncharacterized protein n=1 Tax=Aristolochia fimbriata TaxID=158543 RepID=A0AAV7E2F3_ARIFI|nr:hypothetical protein H6P81_018488 [Aristolochia fimbriata]
MEAISTELHKCSVTMGIVWWAGLPYQLVWGHLGKPWLANKLAFQGGIYVNAFLAVLLNSTQVKITGSKTITTKAKYDDNEGLDCTEMGPLNSIISRIVDWIRLSELSCDSLELHRDDSSMAIVYIICKSN